ncbi:Common central domain of tyrosinase domain containing protein [Rhypophila decipiens]
MVRVLFGLVVAAATVSNAQNIAVTGVPTKPSPNGAVPIRREFRDLQKNFPDQFNLFILGLNAFQAMNEKDMQSYYQISGIHGMPYKPWNGVVSTSDWEETGGFGGYCTHSSILFAPWHRPYIALWEQNLYASVQKVAARFPAGRLRNKYVAAAKDFRSPYWDWAMKPPNNGDAFPTLFVSRNISVVDTDGRNKTVRNPLHRFDFHPVNPSAGDFDESFSRWNYTIRYPNSAEFGVSHDEVISGILSNEMASLRSNVGLLLMSYKDFDAFTYSQWDSETDPGRYGSLEDVHNRIHDVTGGRGHMSYLSVSAFDPLFWMHHINVDRLWAIWQDLQPNSFMSPKPAPYPSTFSTNWKQTEDRNSPLIPFWDNTGSKFWTSEEIRNSTTTFGYAYPETQEWLYSGNNTAYQASIKSAVSKMYQMNVFNRAMDDMRPVSKRSSLSVRRRQQQTDGPVPPPLQHLAPNNTYTEYIFNIRASKIGMGDSFRIFAFLGPYDKSNPSNWHMEKNLVGRVSILTRDMGNNNNSTAGSPRMDPSTLMTSGTIPLTSALLADIIMQDNFMEGSEPLQSLTPEKVVPYLKKNLDWKATMFGSDEEVDLMEIPMLEISVASTSVKLTEEGIPEFESEWVVQKEATMGRAGGMVDEQTCHGSYC